MIGKIRLTFVGCQTTFCTPTSIAFCSKANFSQTPSGPVCGPAGARQKAPANWLIWSGSVVWFCDWRSTDPWKLGIMCTRTPSLVVWQWHFSHGENTMDVERKTMTWNTLASFKTNTYSFYFMQSVLFGLICSELVFTPQACDPAVQRPPAVRGAADHGTKTTQHSSACTL